MKQLMEILILFEKNQNIVIRRTLLRLSNRQEDFLLR